VSVVGRWLRGLGAFWWDFIIGDDWRVAAGVVAAIAVTATLAHFDIAAWWFLPIAVLTLLMWSLFSSVRGARES
jgi:hypothetical protein